MEGGVYVIKDEDEKMSVISGYCTDLLGKNKDDNHKQVLLVGA